MTNDVIYIATSIFSSLLHIWPYLLLSIVLMVGVSIVDGSKYINAIFRKRPIVSIFGATALGGISPLCSCSVIPVISALLRGGVPLAPVMAFWIASPSMDPEIFLLSTTMIGWELSVWRIVSTVILSLGAGFITYGLMSKGYLGTSIVKSPMNSCGSSCSSKSEEGVNQNHITPSRIITETWKASVFIFKFMIIAYFLEAIIKLYVPAEWITGVLGAENSYSIILAGVLGVPMYMTNISALGTISGLLSEGMSSAAALTFIVTGALTSLPALTAVYVVVSKRVFLLYLAIALIGGVLVGYLYSLYTVLF